MGFRVGSGVVSRRLDTLCALEWVQKIRRERGSKTFALTEDGYRVAKAIQELIRILDTRRLE